MKFKPQGWSVEGSLGQGGQGWTYLVRRTDNSDVQLYVLKRLKNKDRVTRFNSEIDALRKLNHPGILKIIAAALPDEEPFYVAEYCARGNLNELDLTELDLLEKLRFFEQICRAVASAHNSKILHRDLKPPNILIRSDGSAVVGDFGLCIDLTDMQERATDTAEGVGARHYIAPELEDDRAEEPKPSSDSYSLGKILYFMFGGRSFARERHRDTAFDLRRKSDSPYIHFVYDLLDKTVVEDEGQRFQDATEMLKAVEGVIVKVEQNAHVLDLKVVQPCLYCISGRYEKFYSEADRIMLRCSNCGHFQEFVMQDAARQWWKKPQQ
jgi:serine/threonine protein kinase